MLPLGIVDNSLGATNISNWMAGGFCYIHRVVPLEGFAIKGLVWYQGEFNPGDIHYARELQTMINTWRRGWGQGAFPVLVVQLHRYGAKPNSLSPPDPHSGWAITRYEQVKATRITPNTGLVVIYDLTHGNLHCQAKGPIGQRVMRLAEGMGYGMGPACAVRSALAAKATFDAKQHLIKVDFQYATHGVRSGPRPHSEISDIFLFTPHGRVIPAKAVPYGRRAIAIDTQGVAGCPDVYYGWRNYPLGNLMNQASFLWVSPFRLRSLHLLPVRCQGQVITLVSNKPLDSRAGNPASYVVAGAKVIRVLRRGNRGVQLTTNRTWKLGERVRISFPQWRCWDRHTPLQPLTFTVLPGRYVTLSTLRQCRVGHVQALGLPKAPVAATAVQAGHNAVRRVRRIYNLAWASRRLLRSQELDLLRGPGPALSLLTGPARDGWRIERCGHNERFNLLGLVKASAVRVWSALARYDVYARRNMDVQLRITDECAGRAYVNGVPVAQWLPYSSCRVPVAVLHRGWNVIVLELTSAGNNRRSGHNFYSLRILNGSGSTPEGISYQAAAGK